MWRKACYCSATEAKKNENDIELQTFVCCRRVRVMPHNIKRPGEQRRVTGEVYIPVERPRVKLATQASEARCHPANTRYIEKFSFWNLTSVVVCDVKMIQMIIRSLDHDRWKFVL